MTKSFNDMWILMLSRHGVKKTEQNLMAKIVKTDWFAHVENVLASAKRVAELIGNGDSALIYCPSGNVGTPLLSSLAQLYLDPYYRTFEGFKVLMLKEWIYYRHNFLKEFQVLSNPTSTESQSSQKPTEQPAGAMYGFGNLFTTQQVKNT